MTGGTTEGREPFVIGYANAGFFSNFLSVLGHLDWCERHGRAPAVYWGPSFVPFATHIHRGEAPRWFERFKYSKAGRWLASLAGRRSVPFFWVDDGYHGCRNGWEYYFEPVSDVKLDGGTRVDNRWHYFTPDGEGIGWSVSERFVEQKRLLEAHGDRGGSLTEEAAARGYTELCDFNWEMRNHPTSEYRRWVGALIERWVRLKPHVREKVEAFAAAHLIAGRTIGAHVRRTDRATEYTLPELTSYWERIEAFPAAERIFLATDSAQALAAFRERYGERLVSYECTRSSGEEAVHFSGCRSPAKGEEVLIDVLLLARCDALVHSNSNVSSAALFWNPELPSVFVPPPAIEGWSERVL